MMPDNTRIMLLINPSRGYTRGLLSGFAQYAHLRASWTFYRPLEYRDKAERSVVQILRKLKPDGIFMREPPELGRIIDMGVPIVCSAYTRDTIPGVANIITDQEAIGRMAAEHLLTQSKEKGKPTLRIEPTHVVARQSTDLLAVEDPAIVTALRFIRQYGRRNIGVQEVVDQAGLSRRLLEKRFRRLVGHSIHDEIQRVRVDFITHILLETNMPISEIAEAMQFTDVAHLARVFRDEKGCSPTQYRLQHAV
jgi:transcriptional regulator GlxA family with amidase domain